jgi:predicted permease
VLTATIFSLVPALRLSRTAIGAQLISSHRRHGSALTRRSSNVLIGVEVAVTIVLLAGAVLMVRTFINVLSQGIGYDPDGLVTVEVQPLAPAPEVNAAFYPAVLNAVRALPEVSAAGAIDDLTIRGGARSFFAERFDGMKIDRAFQRQVMPGYFEALGVRAVAGRLPADTDLTAVQPAVLINEQAARQFFAGTSPVESLITVPYTPVVSMRIIGIVPDIKYSGPEYKASAEFYVVPQNSRLELFGLAVRFRPGQFVSLDRLKRLVDNVGPRAFVGKVAPAMDKVDYSVAKRRQRMWLLGLLGALGLSLTLVGILTMTAYAVAERTHEVGVRMAFGAQPGRIVFEIVRDAAWPIVIGIAMGLGAAFYATRVLQKFLYQTTPHDTVTFIATAILMAVTACIAAWLPARRAARVDPVIALRAE